MIVQNVTTSKVECKQYEDKEEVQVLNCTIEILDIAFATFEYHVTIENCIIDTLEIRYSWFKQGLTIKKSTFKNIILFEAGENYQPIIFSDNIFHEQFIFFDCYFHADVFISHNVFKKTTSLLDTSNYFCTKCVCEHNIGKLDAMSYLSEMNGGHNWGKDIGEVEIIDNMSGSENRPLIQQLVK